MYDYGEYITGLVTKFPNGEIFNTEMIAQQVADYFALPMHTDVKLRFSGTNNIRTL